MEDLRMAGFAYIRQGKYDIALPLFETLCLISKDEAYDFQTLGALYLQLNKPKEAIGCCETALKLEAEHSPTLLNLAKAFFMLGRKAEGLKVAEILSHEIDLSISNPAKALILAYS